MLKYSKNGNASGRCEICEREYKDLKNYYSKPTSICKKSIWEFFFKEKCVNIIYTHTQSRDERK